MKSFLLTFLFSILSHAEETPKVISVDEIYRQPISSAQEISITGGEHISVTDRTHHLVIRGKSPGESTVHSSTIKQKFIVLDKLNYQTYLSLKTITKNMLGPNLTVKKNKVILTGSIHRFSDLIKISKNINPSLSYLRHLKIDSDVLEQFQKYLSHLLKKNNLKAYQWNKNIDKIYFSNEYLTSKERIHQILNPFGIEVIFSKIQSQVKQMVRVNIIIAEVSKNYRKTLGLSWEHNIQHQLLPLQYNSSHLNISLNALEKQGEGQILASPNLICKSDEEASFLAGGEFPIKIVQFKKQDVVWKKYGILLSIKPKVSPNGLIQMELNTEVSTIDASKTVGGIPGLKTNRIQTHFNLKSDQTLLLSGLIKENQGTDRDSLPLLNQIPILGKLFESKNYINNKTELLIFVQPQLIKI